MDTAARAVCVSQASGWVHVVGKEKGAGEGGGGEGMVYCSHQEILTEWQTFVVVSSCLLLLFLVGA